MTIFFDLDGPILDVSERYFRVHQDIIERYGGKSMDKETYWHLKRDRQPLFALLARLGNPTSEHVYRTHWFHKIELKRYLRDDRVIGGAREQLKELGKRHTLILVTLRQRRDHLISQLRELTLRPFFTAVLSASPAGADGTKVKQCLIAESGYLNGYSLIVGDTEIDVRAGKALGVPTVAVLSGIRNRNRLAEEGPDWIVEDICSLQDLVGYQVKRSGERG
jgi:phosphoglycolate phosphatase